MVRDVAVYLRDIVENMEAAEAFVRGLRLKSFTADTKTVYAVMRALEIIGEAVKHVPAAIRSKHPQIPWRQMAGMRDKVIHEYFGVDNRVLWRTVTREIPKIRPLLHRALAQAATRTRRTK